MSCHKINIAISHIKAITFACEKLKTHPTSLKALYASDIFTPFRKREFYHV
jgi:hypothetical protein